MTANHLLLEKCRHNPEWAAKQISDLNKILEAVKQSHFSRVEELNKRIEELEADYERLLTRDTSNLKRLIKANETIEELETRYKAATGLLLSWGNYHNREIMEKAIDEVLRDGQIIGE